ncbi:MAG: endonuclease III domain-containing protein, partial [Chitinivibrionales bacterium]
MSEKLIKIYKALFREYGYQGWWPVTGVADKTSDDPLKQRGYHQGDYDIPLNRSQTFEICLGAVLTQNTSWKNAESAVSNLREKGLLSPERILRCRKETLSEAIRPARYY